MRSNALKRYFVLLLSAFILMSVHAQDITKIFIESHKLDSKITSILVDETENSSIYQQNNDIYVLGWSKDGKMAYIENRGIDGRGGHDFLFTIKDMVEDTNCFYKEIIYYDSGEDEDLPCLSFNDCILNNAEELNDELKKSGIVLSPAKTLFLPAVDSKGNKIDFEVKVLKEDIGEYYLMQMTYEIIASKNGNHKSLGTVKDKICSYAMPTSYIKSPYEDRIALIVANSEHVFEGDEVFITFFGCNLKTGFKKNK